MIAGAQPDEDDLTALARQGITTIINLRRAGESNQPVAGCGRRESQGSRAALCAPAGLGGELRPEQIQAFTQAIERSDGPVYVHCGAGQRASAFALMRKADSQGSAADDVLAKAKEKGIDLPDQAVVGFIRTYIDSKR